jgi:hypothetical protein
MSTLVPGGPLVGVNDPIVGVTANELVLEAVPAAVVTVTGPVAAPGGTCAVMSVDELTTKLGSAVPSKVTLVAPVRLVPRMSTLVASGPPVGENEPIVGGGTTVNAAVLVPVPLGVVSEMGPLVAPLGTVACISESESTVKLAATPLKVAEVAPVKFSPWMSTLVPTGPSVGVNEAITGPVTTVSSTSTSSKYAPLIPQ